MDVGEGNRHRMLFAASGVPVIFGGESPVEASKEVTRIMTGVWFERFRAHCTLSLTRENPGPCH